MGRGQKFHLSAHNYDWNLERTSNNSQSARLTWSVLKSEGETSIFWTAGSVFIELNTFSQNILIPKVEFVINRKLWLQMCIKAAHCNRGYCGRLHFPVYIDFLVQILTVSDRLFHRKYWVFWANFYRCNRFVNRSNDWRLNIFNKISEIQKLFQCAETLKKPKLNGILLISLLKWILHSQLWQPVKVSWSLDRYWLWNLFCRCMDAVMNLTG